MTCELFTHEQQPKEASVKVAHVTKRARSLFYLVDFSLGETRMHQSHNDIQTPQLKYLQLKRNK